MRLHPFHFEICFLVSRCYLIANGCGIFSRNVFVPSPPFSPMSRMHWCCFSFCLSLVFLTCSFTFLNAPLGTNAWLYKTICSSSLAFVTRQAACLTGVLYLVPNSLPVYLFCKPSSCVPGHTQLLAYCLNCALTVSRSPVRAGIRRAVQNMPVEHLALRIMIQAWPREPLFPFTWP